MMVRIFTALIALMMTATLTLAQQGPLRIEITEGVIEPLPFATPSFVPENGNSAEIGAQLASVVAADLQGRSPQVHSSAACLILAHLFNMLIGKRSTHKLWWLVP
jgi:hypothetical protein